MGASRGGGRRKLLLSPVWTFLLSVAVAAGIGIILYLVTTSLPYLASSPTTDPVFGELNQCLIDTLAEPRVGFAVSADGTQAAAYGGASLALCQGQGRDGGKAAGARRALRGISLAAFDFSGTLWVAVERKGVGEQGLWRLGKGGALERVGEFAPVALVGHAGGVVGLDASGRLLSMSGAGAPLGVAQLPTAPVGAVQLSVNADGTLVAAVAGGGLFLFRAHDLARVRAEGPCGVEFLWWRGEADRAVVSCAPKGSWALELGTNGALTPAPSRERTPSALVPLRGVYVQPCETLPCSAPEP